MTYEVWDRDTANRLGEFSSADAAYDLVRCIEIDMGPDTVDDLVLAITDQDGGTMVLAEGKDLIQLAREARLSRAQ